MKRSSVCLAAAGYALACAGLRTTAMAQTELTGNAEARINQQLQQLSNERAALQSENARLKQDLDKVRKDLEKVTAGQAAAENRSRSLQASASRDEAASQQAQQQLEQTRAQMQELVTKFRETAQTLREVEADRASLKSQVSTRERDFKTCVDRNAGLYNLNVEVLEHMENRGFWSAVSEREPFTKLKRTELENLIDDYRYRADELRLEQQQAQQQAQQKNQTH